MYYAYRFRASKSNTVLRNRARAAEILGISESSLSNYETGKTKCVPPEMVAQMASVYNAPELRNIYCTSVCPVGHNLKLATTEAPIEKIAVHLINCTNEQRLHTGLCKFLRIAEEGLDSDKERRELKEVAEIFGPISFAISEFSILAERQGATWN